MTSAEQNLEVTFATGTDARFFWNVCALSESFAQQNPEYQVQVADFGFTQAVGSCIKDAAVIAEALAKHGASVAVCRDDSGLSVEAFVAAYREVGMPVEPFDTLLLESGGSTRRRADQFGLAHN